MAWPAIAAILGALGVVSGIGQMQTGTNVSSHSTLSPIQQLWAMQLMSGQGSEMQDYFKTLGGLGENAQNPYDVLQNSKTDFYEKVKLPMLQRQQSDLTALSRDPSHQRIADMLKNRMKEQNTLAINQMGADFENQSRLMKIQGKETSLGNQLNALGMMKGNFWQPMGVNMQENYYNPGVSIPGAIGAGVSGISSIMNAIQNSQQGSQLEDLLNKLNTTWGSSY